MAEAALVEGSVLDTREFGLHFHGAGLNDYAEIEAESGSWTGDDGSTVDCEDGWSRSVSERGYSFGHIRLENGTHVSASGTFVWQSGNQYQGQWADGKRSTGSGVFKWGNGNSYEGPWGGHPNVPHTAQSGGNAAGTMTWSNGDVYVGEWCGGRKDGQGTFSWSSGAVYEGAWQEDNWHGEGKLVASNPEDPSKSDTYTGQYRRSVRHGHGTLEVSTGDQYTGQWDHGCFGGNGTYTTAAGNVFSGRFVNDKRVDGRGTFTWANQNIYDGQWVDKKRSGKGEMVWSKSGNVFVGEWLDDKKHGAGTLRMVNGDELVAHWEAGIQVDGPGAFSWANGNKYSGQWVTSKMDGEGLFTWANSDWLKAEWSSGHKIDGFGQFCASNGDKYDGQFIGEEKHGDGHFRWANGDSYEGQWVNNAKEGAGALHIQHRAKYEGQFKNDLYEGHGVLLLECGDEYTGEFKGGNRDGQGEQHWSREGQKTAVTHGLSIYTGQWADDVPCGEGTCTFFNGDTFQGQFAESRPNGLGTFTWNAVTKATFKGMFARGIRQDGHGEYDSGPEIAEHYTYVGEFAGEHMHGTGEWSKPAIDEVYKGTFNNGTRHGQGVLAFIMNGHTCTFEGQWRDDVRHGAGDVVWDTEESYNGIWSHGALQDAEGTFFWEANKYVGKLENNLKSGRGDFTWANGDSYSGQWLEDSMHGQGEFEWRNGDKHVGRYRNGKMHGEGVYTTSLGEVYRGEFSESLRHGKGSCKYLHGGLYTGEWYAGVKQGSGRFLYPDGSYYEGAWSDGTQAKGQGDYFSLFSVDEMISRAKKGSMVVLYKDNQRVECFVSLTPSSQQLVFENAGRQETLMAVDLERCEDMEYGVVSSSFKRMESVLQEPKWHCFSLVLESETIDMAVLSAEQLIPWYMALQACLPSADDAYAESRGCLLWRAAAMRCRYRSVSGPSVEQQLSRGLLLAAFFKRRGFMLNADLCVGPARHRTASDIAQQSAPAHGTYSSYFDQPTASNKPFFIVVRLFRNPFGSKTADAFDCGSPSRMRLEKACLDEISRAFGLSVSDLTVFFVLPTGPGLFVGLQLREVLSLGDQQKEYNRVAIEFISQLQTDDSRLRAGNIMKHVDPSYVSRAVYLAALRADSNIADRFKRTPNEVVVVTSVDDDEQMAAVKQFLAMAIKAHETQSEKTLSFALDGLVKKHPLITQEMFISLPPPVRKRFRREYQRALATEKAGVLKMGITCHVLSKQGSWFSAGKVRSAPVVLKLAVRPPSTSGGSVAHISWSSTVRSNTSSSSFELDGDTRIYHGHPTLPNKQRLPEGDLHLFLEKTSQNQKPVRVHFAADSGDILSTLFLGLQRHIPSAVQFYRTLEGPPPVTSGGLTWMQFRWRMETSRLHAGLEGTTQYIAKMMRHALFQTIKHNEEMQLQMLAEGADEYERIKTRQARQEAELLENQLNAGAREEAATKIQAVAAGFKVRNDLKKLKAAIKLQCFCRVQLSKAVVFHRRCKAQQLSAVTLLQLRLRFMLHFTRFRRRQASVRLQCFIRVILARSMLRTLNVRRKAAIMAQCAWRTYWAKLNVQLMRDRRNFVLHAEQATADAVGRDEREAQTLKDKRAANKLAREVQANAAGRDFDRELLQARRAAHLDEWLRAGNTLVYFSASSHLSQPRIVLAKLKVRPDGQWAIEFGTMLKDSRKIANKRTVMLSDIRSIKYGYPSRLTNADPAMRKYILLRDPGWRHFHLRLNRNDEQLHFAATDDSDVCKWLVGLDRIMGGCGWGGFPAQPLSLGQSAPLSMAALLWLRFRQKLDFSTQSSTTPQEKILAALKSCSQKQGKQGYNEHSLRQQQCLWMDAAESGFQALWYDEKKANAQGHCQRSDIYIGLDMEQLCFRWGPSARGKPGQVSKFGKGQLSRLKFNVPLRCVKEVRFGPHTNTTPAEHLRRLQSSDSNSCCLAIFLEGSARDTTGRCSIDLVMLNEESCLSLYNALSVLTMQRRLSPGAFFWKRARMKARERARRGMMSFNRAISSAVRAGGTSEGRANLQQSIRIPLMAKGTKCMLWQGVPRSTTAVGSPCMLYMLPDGETVHYIDQNKKSGTWKLESANQVRHGAVTPLWRLLDENYRPNPALCVSLVFQTRVVDLSFNDDYSTLLWFLGMKNVVSPTPQTTGSFLWERVACRLQENAHATKRTRKVMLLAALRCGQIVSRETAVVRAQQLTTLDYGIQQVRFAQMKRGCAVKMGGANIDTNGFGWAQLSIDGNFLNMSDPASRSSAGAQQFPLSCLLRISYGSYGANPAWMFKENKKQKLQKAQNVNEAEDWLRMTLVFGTGTLEMVFLDFAALETFFYGLHDKIHRTPLNRGRLLAAKAACILRSVAIEQNRTVAQLLIHLINQASTASKDCFAADRLALQAQKALVATALHQMSADGNMMHVMHVPQRVKNTKPVPAKIRLSLDRQQLFILPQNTRDDFPATLLLPLQISSISGLVFGPVMPAFAERLSSGAFDPANCFTILCNDPQKDKNKAIADIVCADRQQLMAFFLGIQSLTNKPDLREFQLTRGQLLWEHAKVCLATKTAKKYGGSCTRAQRAQTLADVIRYGGIPAIPTADSHGISKACSCRLHELKNGELKSTPVYMEVDETHLILRKQQGGKAFVQCSLDQAISFLFGMNSLTFEKAGESGLLAWRAMTIAFAATTLDLTFDTDSESLDWAAYFNGCFSPNLIPLRSRDFYEWKMILLRLDLEAGGVEGIFSEQERSLTPSEFVKKVRASGIQVSDVACASLLAEADTDGDGSMDLFEMNALLVAR